MTDEPITRDEEQSFLEAKSQVSKYLRSLSQKLPADVPLAGDKLQELLRQAISIAHLRSLPKTDRQILANLWHVVFFNITRATGYFQMISEGYVPPPRAAKRGTDLKDIRGGGVKITKPKRANPLKSGMFWAILIILGVVAWFFMKK